MEWAQLEAHIPAKYNLVWPGVRAALEECMLHTHFAPEDQRAALYVALDWGCNIGRLAVVLDSAQLFAASHNLSISDAMVRVLTSAGLR